MAESCFYYYGARYYNPTVSMWLSVDAMASKGPNITPYAFTHNNPVMLVDPDGNWPKWMEKIGNGIVNVSSALFDTFIKDAHESKQLYIGFLNEITISAERALPRAEESETRENDGSFAIWLFGPSEDPNYTGWNSNLDANFTIDTEDPALSYLFYGPKKLKKPSGGADTFMKGVEKVQQGASKAYALGIKSSRRKDFEDIALPDSVIFNLHYDYLKEHKHRLSYDYKDSAKWHDWINRDPQIHIEKVETK